MVQSKPDKEKIAQALHRKANRPEIDAILAKKADLSDLQRVIAALESKIDLGSFESLVRAVESKADKNDLMSQRHLNSTEAIERSLVNDRSEIDRKVQEVEKSTKVALREVESELDQIKNNLGMNLTQKVDYRDLDEIVG